MRNEYYIYPEGSRGRHAKTSKRWKAYYMACKLRLREIWRFAKFGVQRRRIVTETHKAPYAYRGEF